jgi:2-dehydro-3-deoxyglucarate aldolase/4-hydroxy-2-oxoheptanedioate aldolase
MAQVFENRVKGLLKAGKKTAGAWSQLCSSASTEILCRAGFDWILIDLEHSPNDMQTLLWQLQAMNGYGVVPIVRAPWNDLVWIKRILDAGAYGVMIPSVNTREQAVAAVAACKYPPLGVRGIAGSPRAAGFGRDTAGYLKRANDEILVILQVETPQSVANLDEIGKVPGVDMLFIGPMDLSTAMGHMGNLSHPEVQTAIATVEAKAKALGIPLGTVATGWDQSKALYDRGYQFVTLMSDVAFLSRGSVDLLAKFREMFSQG